MVKSVRGFTLVELVLALGMLGLFSLALFAAFDFGARSFRLATQRQDSQAAVTRAYISLRDDLRRSHFRSTAVFERRFDVDGEEVSRDSLTLASLKDWAAESSFDEWNGLPKWDRYVHYYATTDGKLVRANLDPDRPDFSPVPFPDLDEDRYLHDAPEQNSGYQTDFKIVSQDLLEFSCQRDPSNDHVLAACRLEFVNRGKKHQSEIRVQVFPQNTWPKGES